MPTAGAPALQRLASGRAVPLSLVAIAAVSMLVRILLVGQAHAPTVFNDELGYAKLAQSIGLEGRLALLNEEGFSYAPLYPAVLSPIYALGASGASAYTLMKVLNALLMSLSVFPLYRVARFALPPPRALLVAGVSVVVPLMSYTYFTMTENLAYPLCLVGIWAMLAAVRRPGPAGDAVLLTAVLLATAARIQLIVLLPAALTAVLLAAAARKDSEPGGRLLRALREHWLLFGIVSAGLLAGGIRALAGGDVYSVFGRYANVGRAGLPSPWRTVVLAVHHLAGLDLAVGVIAFVGTLVAATAFVRAGFPSRYLPFAAVATSFTFWLLLQVAVDAALIDMPGGDERIHERFLIYAVPLFLVALLAVVQRSNALLSTRVHLGAATVAAALPAVIPFNTDVQNAIGFETFTLVPFARTNAAGELMAVPWARAFAVVAAATLALSYVRMLRGSLRRTLVYVTVAFVLVSAAVWSKVESASTFARSTLPAHADWVDRAKPRGEVIVVAADPFRLAALETVYHNLTIGRIIVLCGRVDVEFGERDVTIDSTGTIRAGSEQVRARYAVVPEALHVRGRVVARDGPGELVLLAPFESRLTANPAGRLKACS